MHKISQINVSSNFGRNTKSQSLTLICSSQNLGWNLKPRSNWSTSTSWWGFSPYSRLTTWVDSSMVGCGQLPRLSLVFCRREPDLCERQTLIVHQLKGQNTDWWKESFGGLRTLTGADAGFEDPLRAGWSAVSDDDHARSGCFYQLPALSQETADAPHLSTAVDTQNCSL